MILCRQLVHEIEAKALERRVEDEVWYRKQKLLKEAEEERRKILIKEEEKLAEQRKRYFVFVPPYPGHKHYCGFTQKEPPFPDGIELHLS